MGTYNTDHNVLYELFQFLEEGVLLLRPDSRSRTFTIFDANDAASRLTGFSRDQMMHKSITEVLPTGMNHNFAELLLDTQLHGGLTSISQFHFSENGRSSLFHIRIIKLSTGDLSILFSDITNHQKSRGTLEKPLVHTSMGSPPGPNQEIYGFLKLIKAIDVLEESIVIADKRGILVFVNKNTCTLLGLGHEQLIGKNIGFIKGWLSDSHLFQQIKDIMLLKEIWHGVLELQTDEGTKVVDTTITPLPEDEGEGTHFIIVSRDITQNAGEQQRMLQARKMESIGTLAGGIAHDFNNILFPIMGYAELTLEDPLLSQESTENVTAIFNASKRAKELIRQILSFSRESSVVLKPVNICPILKEAIKMLRSTIPTSVKIKYDIDDVAPVMADITELHQVIMNLCTNAWHALPKSTGTITINLSEEEIDDTFLWMNPHAHKGRFAKLSVADTGTGIAAEHIHKIFEPYFSTKTPERGTGLGLAVVDGIVKQHNGFLIVQTFPGEGSCFEVYLPLAKIDTPAQPKHRSSKFILGTGHIMVIDDDQGIVSLITKSLSKAGYSVTGYTNPMEGLEAFYETPEQFNLIITDMTMPDLCGDKLIMAVKQVKDVPVIIMTGFSEYIDSENFASFGAEKFIYKPFTIKSLSRAVFDIMNKLS